MKLITNSVENLEEAKAYVAAHETEADMFVFSAEHGVFSYYVYANGLWEPYSDFAELTPVLWERCGL